jgi:hypothetical protein
LRFLCIEIESENTETLTEVGLEIKTGKTKYTLLSRHQNADIEIANRSFENASQLKYLGSTVTNQNLTQKEIKSRLNSGNACYHSAQNLLSSRLLSKNVRIRVCKTIILPVVLCGCRTWSLTLREEHRLGGVLQEGAEEDIWAEEGRGCRRMEKTA